MQNERWPATSCLKVTVALAANKASRARPSNNLKPRKPDVGTSSADLSQQPVSHSAEQAAIIEGPALDPDPDSDPNSNSNSNSDRVERGRDGRSDS